MVKLRGTEEHLQLNTAFNHSGFWGRMRYIPNLCSVAPFAYAMGIKELIMGSSLIEDKLEPALMEPTHC
ncbi:MAG: hypothetical protein ACLUVG_21235 [Phocaeicola vulgatus]